MNRRSDRLSLGLIAQAGSWYTADLQRAAVGLGLRLQTVSFADLAGAVDTNGSPAILGPGFEPLNLDGVLVRTMPPASLEQIVFRMDALAQWEASGVPVINPPRALEACIDKYLTSCRVARCGCRVPETRVCQNAEAAMAAFEALGGDAVIKPLFGGEGRGIARVSDPDLAFRAFRLLERGQDVIYLQRFIEHNGYDLRLLRIGERWISMKRIHRDDWRTNISRGAIGEPYQPTDDEVDLARRASDAVGCELAGVDLLTGTDGKKYVLEVNGVPGWRRLAQVALRDIATDVLNFVVQTASQHLDPAGPSPD